MFAIDILQYVRAANMQGRLFNVPTNPVIAQALDAFVRVGLVLPVEATPTSSRGYVAVGSRGIAGGDAAAQV